MLVELNSREQFVLWRRRNKVRIQQIADYMKCVKSYISMFENEKIDFPLWRLNQYKQFIKDFEERKLQEHGF